MSGSFAPCPSCRRHVRARAEQCPFCRSPLDVDVQRQQVRPGADPRLGRAAALVAAAALTVAACGDDESDGRGIAVPAYGIPVAGAAGSSSTAGSGGAAGDGGAAGEAGAGNGGAAGSAGSGAAGSGGGGTAGAAGEAGAGGQQDAGSGGEAGAPAPPYGLPPD